MKKLSSLLGQNKNTLLAAAAAVTIALHLLLRYILKLPAQASQTPLLVILVIGGIPLFLEQIGKLLKRDFGADLLAGLSILTAVLLKEYLAGAIVVLMLSGGKALESYAVRSASSVLNALAKRMPSSAHRRSGSTIADIDVKDIAIGDVLILFPHEICPVDGTVIEGSGVMNEAYLTGEPFDIDKAPGVGVISGAVNGSTALTITAAKLPVDSRYAKIMEVMKDSEQNRPQLRRLGDQLGAFYAPVALAVALAAWGLSGDVSRFLSVLLIATPCPLLIGIPVAIIGSISVAAKNGIVIKNPAILEQIGKCRTAIFDKTGTLTYGTPELSANLCAPGFNDRDVLSLAASLERYSRHPLAHAITEAAKKNGATIHEASEVHEVPGEGLKGVVNGRTVQVTGRKTLLAGSFKNLESLPRAAAGLECAILIDGVYAAMFQFRDTPRAEGLSFIRHLGPQHQLNRSLIVSGDRESEVRYLAEKVGITEIYAGKSPEEKLVIVRSETRKAKTIYVGDGINDAPALMAATVGIAVGQNSDITSQAAGAVILNSSLRKVDELIHIGRRMRTIALQSAVGGMLLCFIGMYLAATGRLTPVAGAVAQEAIDVLAVLNALRTAFSIKKLSDF